MNKIYKVIWSKAKNCYVVVSEIAKRNTKGSRSRVHNAALIKTILASVTGMVLVGSIWTSNSAEAALTNNDAGDLSLANSGGKVIFSIDHAGDLNLKDYNANSIFSINHAGDLSFVKAGL